MNRSFQELWENVLGSFLYVNMVSWVSQYLCIWEQVSPGELEPTDGSMQDVGDFHLLGINEEICFFQTDPNIL